MIVIRYNNKIQETNKIQIYVKRLTLIATVLVAMIDCYLEFEV